MDFQWAKDFVVGVVDPIVRAGMFIADKARGLGEMPTFGRIVIVRVWGHPTDWTQNAAGDAEAINTDIGAIQGKHHPITLALDVALNAALGRHTTFPMITFSDQTFVTADLTNNFVEVRLQRDLSFAEAADRNSLPMRRNHLDARNWVAAPGWLPAIQNERVTTADVLAAEAFGRTEAKVAQFQATLPPKVEADRQNRINNGGSAFRSDPNSKQHVRGDGVLYKLMSQVLDEQAYKDTAPSVSTPPAFSNPATPGGLN